MLEVIITRSLMEAIKIKTKVVFVGDVDQLPPIGPGCILKDLIKSGCVNINTLTIPKRQLEKSTIISNAKNIISKEMIKSDDKRNDFFVLNKKTERMQGCCKSTRQLMEKRIILKQYTNPDPLKEWDIRFNCPQLLHTAGI